MAGATVRLDGDTTNLDKKVVASKQKIEEAARSGGKAFTASFDAGTVALGKMVAGAATLAKIVNESLGAFKSYSEKIAKTSEEFAGRKLKAGLAAETARLPAAFGTELLTAKGTTTGEQRVSFLEGLGRDMQTRYGDAESKKEAAKLYATGLASEEESMIAAKSGKAGIAFLKKLVDKRKHDLTKEQRAEYDTQVEIQRTRAAPGLDAVSQEQGERTRKAQALGELEKRKHPGEYTGIEAVPIIGESVSENRALGKGFEKLNEGGGPKQTNIPQLLEAAFFGPILTGAFSKGFGQELSKDRNARMRPNYTPSH